MSSRSTTSIRLACIAAALTAVAVSVVLALPQDTRAQSDETFRPLFNREAGPFDIAMSWVPPSPQVGFVNTGVKPTLLSDGSPVTDARITLVAETQPEHPEFKVVAVNTPSDPEVYRANLKFEEAGNWFLGFQSERSDTSQWLARPPDLPRLASNSELVVEGVVTQKDSHSYKSQQASTGRTVSVAYTLYQVEVAQYWRGTGSETISVAIRDFSPVELTIGQSYLLFLGGMADEDKLPGYWYLVAPERVWTVDEKTFHPYPGLPPSAAIRRQEMADILALNSHR